MLEKLRDKAEEKELTMGELAELLRRQEGDFIISIDPAGLGEEGGTGNGREDGI